MPDWSAFDDEILKKLLLETSRKGFCRIKQQYSDEHLYCFALYSHGSYSFVYTAASSEEGLTRAAEKHMTLDVAENHGWFNGLNLDQVRMMLRHNIGDSPLHEPTIAESLFKVVCDLTEIRSNILFNKWCEVANEGTEEAAFAAVQPQNQQFLDICFDVLRQLDREGLFGKGKQRQRVVLNFLTAGQSREEMVSYARALNPPAVVKRYVKELDVASGIHLTHV